jgi:TolB-like protein/Flp pilus assembly protein TadD/DNA-binding winged helix-turn-helix (wHTH) protein
MDATDLQHGFTLGEWLVEPAASRISGPAGSHPLTTGQREVLLALAGRRGEALSRRELRELAWPGVAGTDTLLRDTVRSLREVLGGSAADRRYIVGAEHGGYVLLAPVVRHTVPGVPPAAVPAADPPPAEAPGHSLYALLAELRRRNVLKVVGTYLVFMWLVLQVAETTFEPLQLPAWWMTALTILAVVGLPIVTVLAWSYEITAGGVVLDGGSPPGIRLPRARRAIAPAIVAGVALMATVTGYAWWRTLGAQSGEAASARAFEPDPRSIAVLPFVDMSPAGDAAYVGDGLGEELASDFAKLPGLRVAARTSAFAYRGRDVDVRNIGAQLGVRYVLEGSVRRDGERVRVTAQLIDATSGFRAWTESYDRPTQDLIGIQQEISGAIARQLQAVLTPELARRLGTASTRNPRAYDDYLSGLWQLRQGGGLSRIAEAERLFRRSLEADPAFARAQAGLCQAAIARYERTGAREAVQAAEAACRAALEADATLKETELALGQLYLASGRLDQAEAVFSSLLAAAPADADVHIGLGRTLARMNRKSDAEQRFREAIEVEPGYWQAYNSLGTFLFGVGRIDEAAQAYARVTELAPGNPSGHNNLGAARMLAGDLTGAADAFEQSRRIEPSRASYSNLGTLYYFLGRLDEAVAMYDRAIELAPEDYQLRGGRADARWFQDGQQDRAREDYRRGVALAEQALAVDANDGDTWAMLGYFYGRLGDAERSARYMSRALELAPDSPQVAYFAAVAAASRGDREEAASQMRRAIAQGYAKALAVPDPLLRGIPIG